MRNALIVEKIRQQDKQMSVFNYQKDQDGIVTITMDMTGPVNAMNAEYHEAMHNAVNY